MNNTTISITLEEAAKRLNLGYKTVQKLVKRGIIPARKIGQSWSIGVLALEAWANNPQQIHISTAPKAKTRKQRVTVRA